jgi:hypothetical protein
MVGFSCGTCKHYGFNEDIPRSECVSGCKYGWFCYKVNFEISHTTFHLLSRVGCRLWENGQFEKEVNTDENYT